MQSISPVTTEQLLQKGQQPLLKFEIKYCCCWVDLTDLGGKNYLKSISISTAGAEMTPNPVAGQWSAVINNKNGRFDPDEPGYAPYNEYFKAGRKVKISVGAKYDGVDYYWRRIYGFMEIPDFSIHDSEVSLSGFDNTQFLTDTKLKEPENYWGTLAIFDSVATTLVGPELYDSVAGDAAEIIPGEANLSGDWAVETNGATAISSQGQIGGFSLFELEFIANPGDTVSAVWYQTVCAVVAGTEYFVTFKYARTAGDDAFRLTLRDGAKTIGGSGRLDPAVNGEWYTGSFSFTPSSNANLDLYLTSRVHDGGSTFRVDNISIKSVTSTFIYRYEMPEECMGIHYVELDEGEGFVPVWPGRQKDGDEGWFYDSVLNQFYFAEGKIVEDGTANLKVYYYTDQIPENVVADLLARAGLYSNQAEALAAMIYTATSILIDKVWFKSGSTCLDAVKMLCERCNYRFYFNYGERPVFKPTPMKKVPGSEDFSFLESHITGIRDYEDRNEIRNRIVIEGIEQALPEGAEETKPSKFKGEILEVASINKYGEHTMSITNHLFQDQASVDAYCAIYLAAFKDPKWYTTFDTPFNPVPLVKGDTIKWRKKYEAGGTPINQRGIIRDIQISDNVVTYTNKKVSYFPSDEDLRGYWPFDKGTGMVAYDKSKYGNNGSLENMTEADWVAGKVGKCLDFDGENDLVEVPYNANLDNPSAFAINAWAKSDILGSAYDDLAFIVDMGAVADTGYGILLHNATDEIRGYYNNVYVSCDTTLDTDWHHYVLTYDSSEGVLRLYRDGELQDSAGVAEGTITDNPLRIGAQSKDPTKRWWNGLIDEVRFYNRALTEVEIKALYEGE